MSVWYMRFDRDKCAKHVWLRYDSDKHATHVCMDIRFCRDKHATRVCMPMRPDHDKRATHAYMSVYHVKFDRDKHATQTIWHVTFNHDNVQHLSERQVRFAHEQEMHTVWAFFLSLFFSSAYSCLRASFLRIKWWCNLTALEMSCRCVGWTQWYGRIMLDVNIDCVIFFSFLFSVRM